MSTPRPTHTRTSSLLWPLRLTALLHAALLLVEFVTAGRLIIQDYSALPLHSMGAVAVHIAAGLQVLAAVLLWRPGGGPLWPTAVSAAALGAGIAQAYFGSARMLDLHVPMAMLVVILVTWVLAWCWTRSSARTNDRAVSG
ncbi:hypothetical protein HNR23_001935 [Nocardiopsis mwathae]|uniref:Integral membrane protein n=1 Tax=Nocardiopsis mwathae TaxID=1472723 RepID=A0A7X0D564_9ACTN|nr:hypothetical protein [Nocardiopsis mwathae]MBB6171875.1 hypothetical protein [Nocardiopsis mwathae]